MSPTNSPPVVMIIAGNDPSGGAGISADIQAIAALGGHPAPVVTALTVQDTRNAYRVEAAAAELVIAQARAVLADLHVRAIKIGLLATSEIAGLVADLLQEHPNIPVVLDPVLVAAGGAALAEDALTATLLDRLLPLTTLLTPNALEIRRLAGEARRSSLSDDRDGFARALLAYGCRYVLAKGADEDTPGVENVLYGKDGMAEVFRWRRLPEQYHGSGCTLAAAITALIARGRPIPAAVAEAQRYTWQALQQAYRPGNGQHVPRRLVAAQDD
ncbi:MAG: hydroxymethylpyrimidine/phosphomethylpyrimidine kinase [Gammaproteobacteria bacterium]